MDWRRLSRASWRALLIVSYLFVAALMVLAVVGAFLGLDTSGMIWKAAALYMVAAILLATIHAMGESIEKTRNT